MREMLDGERSSSSASRHITWRDPRGLARSAFEMASHAPPRSGFVSSRCILVEASPGMAAGAASRRRGVDRLSAPLRRSRVKVLLAGTLTPLLCPSRPLMLLRRRRRGVSRLTRRAASPLRASPCVQRCVSAGAWAQLQQRSARDHDAEAAPGCTACLTEPARDAQGVLIRFGVGTGPAPRLSLPLEASSSSSSQSDAGWHKRPRVGGSIRCGR